ncbi:SemiSWEET family sugar transporter [Bradyrhizobium barranii]|jgi:MtN3 and saliva related transmembrane protein|uniref:SemiSWEET family sugar transporter n=1 Tax=Bradyrhizobium TaxID=374 RepID=UPI003F24E104
MSGSLSTYVGSIAAFLASLSYIPQVRKAWPRNSTDDLSLGMLRALTLGLGLWTVYGLIREDWVIVLANVGPQDTGSVRLRPTSQHVHVRAVPVRIIQGRGDHLKQFVQRERLLQFRQFQVRGTQVPVGRGDQDRAGPAAARTLSANCRPFMPGMR